MNSLKNCPVTDLLAQNELCQKGLLRCHRAELCMLEATAHFAVKHSGKERPLRSARSTAATAQGPSPLWCDAHHVTREMPA